MLRDTDFYSVVTKDYDDIKEINKLKNIKQFCSYIRIHNINMQIHSIDKFEKETGELMHHNALLKFKELKEKMRKINKEKINE